MPQSMPPFQAARVLVVGDVMLDRYYHGSATRISPEAPVPVVRVNNQEDRPGGAGNVALNIAALGGAATLIGVVGADATAKDLSSRLAAAGVRCEFLESADKPTITKLRVISQHQQLLRMDFEQQFDAADVADLAHSLRVGARQRAGGYRFGLCEGCAAGCTESHQSRAGKRQAGDCGPQRQRLRKVPRRDADYP